MANFNTNRALNGINSPLSYLGVNPGGVYAPSQTVTNSRVPTINDSKNFILGCFWLVPSTVALPADNSKLFMLTALIGNDATWTELEMGASTGILTLTGNTGGAVSGDPTNINVVGAGGITVTGNPGTHTLTITTSGGVGVIDTIDGDVGFITGPTVSITGLTTAGSTVSFVGNNATAMTLDTTDGSGNTIIGFSAGNATVSGTGNTGLGQAALHALTSGSFNLAIGGTAGSLLTTGADNTLIGSGAGIDITTGSTNIAVGFDAANNYTSSESSNIIIGNSGVVAESHTLRIGTNGGGAGQQSRCFVAGIDGVNVGSTANVVTEVGNQLGTAVITAGANITVTPGANTITIAATGSASAGTGSFSAVIPIGTKEERAVVAAPLSLFYGTNSNTAAPMTAYFNNGSNFFVGDGASAAATYTAPGTGVYTFSMWGFFTCSSSAGGTIFPTFIIRTPARDYSLGYGGGTSPFSNPYMFTQVVNLTLGDVVTFLLEFAAPGGGATNTVTIHSGDSSDVFSTAGLCGYRLS